MLKTKVSCWFCNEDTHVFVFNKNSWTCPKCEQYNGFNKDGDYNKPIPEMQIENNAKKFCVNGNGTSGSSGSLLCDKCNNNQEMKLLEMKKFESTMDEKSEREYNSFKKKLDHIYDICKPCKLKLTNHLRNIDQQIGNNYIRYRNNNNTNTPSVTNGTLPQAATKETPTANPLADVTNTTTSPTLVTNQFSAATLCDNFKSTFKKAYTIAGTVPAYVFKSSSSFAEHKSRHRHNGGGAFAKLKYEIAPASTIEEETLASGDDKSMYAYEASNGATPTTPTGNTSQLNKSASKRRRGSGSKNGSFSCDSLTIVGEDMLLFGLVLLVLACDAANLVNDSGVLQLEKNTNYEWFTSLLELYKHVVVWLLATTVVSLHLVYKRPKLSRLLMMLGFATNLLVHFHVLDLTSEEQFISEVFISFFLAAYIVVARAYNLFQLVRYM